ncbi:MAG TPA: TIGR03118 family protein, partial [Anaerolineales bacterium]
YLAVTPSLALSAGYIQRNLVSDIPLLADYTDPNMVNPWGIALAPFWICNNRTGTFNVNGPDGAPSTTMTTVPAAPGRTGTGRCTGAVRNNNNAAFQVSPGVNGQWILDTEDGLITVRQGATSVIKVDNSASGAVYKGIALRNSPDYIYAANFNSGKIDVYDGNWTAATLPGTFTDPQVPADFAPFNIQNLGGKLYVAYAKQDSAKRDDVAGPGNGYVAVFDTNGNLLQHLISNGPLNSPWGLAIAPANWGEFSNALLVGNFRDGLINAFDATTGQFLGTMTDPSGRPIVNIGLWALQIGFGGNGGDPTKIYFTAGISAGSGIQSHGLFGSLSAFGVPPAVNVSGIVNNASYAPGSTALAPGSIAAVFGTYLTDGNSCLPPSCNPTFDNGTPRRLRTFMAGAQVTINGFPVPLFYASPLVLGIQIPTDLTGTSATVQVTVNGQASTVRTLSIDAFSPGIFTVNGQGTGAGAITHLNGSLVNAANPAELGETVVIYATGLGQVAPAVPTGALPSGTSATVATPIVTIDGLAAPQVPFSGLSGGGVGLNQINVVVPPAVRIANNIPVVLSIGGKQSNTVTIAVAEIFFGN